MSPSQFGASAQQALKTENQGAIAFLDVPSGSRGIRFGCSGIQKRKADVLKNAYVEAHLRVERVLTHLIDQKKRMVFSPSQVAMETEDGHKLDSRDNPRSAFGHHWPILT